MSSSREGPNPLRPYYIPPSVGSPPDQPLPSTGVPNVGSRPPLTSTASFGTSARNILSDIDYSDYLAADSSSPSVVVKGLVEQALWKYMSVFLAQPFDVTKTILQAHVARAGQRGSVKDTLPEESRRRHDIYENSSGDDSDDSPSYFTSSAPLAPTPSRPSRPRRRRRQTPSPDGVPRVHTPQPPPNKPRTPHCLDLKSSSAILSCLSTLWNVEGAWGVWKGTNTTYIYSLLLSTVTSFTRSFFSAFLALPDPGLSFTSSPVTNTPSAAGGLNILSSPSPIASLLISVSAAGVAGILLAPLDIARTKLILTPSTHPPRSIMATLNSLPTWLLPLSIAPSAILHSTLPTLISASTPLVLRNRLGIDPLITPILYNIGTFGSQVAELAVKLPIETVLRRGQMAVARETSKGREIPTIVDVGAYNGLLGTMRSIIYEEGESDGISPTELAKGAKGAAGMKVSKEKRRKGQGVEGLWRGWRVGMWGLVGVWGAAMLGGVGGKGGEF